MIYYVLLFFLLYVIYFFDLSINKTYTSNRFIYLAFFILLVFSSSRYMVGWDYKHYYAVVAYSVDNNITLGGETLTVFLVKLTRYLGVPYFYFLINAVIILAAILYFVRKYSLSPWLSFFVFFGFPLFYLNSFSVIRLFSALGFVLIAISFLERSRFFLYFTLVFLASMFHKSALIALVFPVFIYIKPSMLLWVLALSAAPFMGDFANVILGEVIDVYMPKYSLYLSDTDKQEGTKAIYVFLAVALAITIFKKKVGGVNTRTELFYNIYMFGVFIYLLLLDNGTAGHRTSLYATILLIVLLPNFISKIKPVWLSRFFTFLIHVLFVIFFFYTIVVGSETYIPYKTIFLK